MVTATANQLKIRTTKVYESILQAMKDGKKGILLEGGTYSSKCVKFGTRIIMYDMAIMEVQDIKVGDKLMGVDGTPREVLKLYSGQDNLYKIKQAKGIDYTVSSHHILSLRENWKEIRKSVPNPEGNTRQRRKYIRNDHSNEIVNTDLQEYIGKSGKWKRRHKGWKLAGVELPYQPVLIEPYFLGLWLGDGDKHTTSVTNIDQPIIDYLKWFCVRNNLRYSQGNYNKNHHSLARNSACGVNPLREALKEYKILNNKQIPHAYLYNNRTVRLELLAGLIDSDGYKSNNCTYVITQKIKGLTENIALLARSLGFPSKIYDEIARMKRADGSVYECPVHRVEFTGDNIADIPVKLPRKILTNKPLPRRYSSSIEVEPAGIGDYYGFELDRDHLFLLEDFTVTHNTYSTLQALLVTASRALGKVDIDIVSESIPHLKGGCIKDFFNILDESYEKNPYYNQTDHIYKMPAWKGVLTFLSADNEKALGMRRDILFINEGDTLSWEIARELISRTNIFTIIDWNPRSEFWAHEYYRNDPKWAYDHSTYLDALDVIPRDKAEDIVDLGEKDPNYRNVYELGLMGKVEGIVFPYFDLVDELPQGVPRYGLDYGFAKDPTVLVKSVIVGDSLYSHQLFYDDRALTNDDIAREMSRCYVGNEIVWADPTEPKSAEELRRLGFNVQAIDKAYANTAFGIKQVNAYHQYWTKDSLECIKEQRNCHYIKRKEPNTGRVYWSDDISHQWSHGMKARMYSIATFKPHQTGVRAPATSYM